MSWVLLVDLVVGFSLMLGFDGGVIFAIRMFGVF